MCDLISLGFFITGFVFHMKDHLHAVKYNENIVHRDRFAFSVITEFNLVYTVEIHACDTHLRNNVVNSVVDMH